MRVLVTGGSGFVGRNLLEHLSRRHEVLAPTHAELDLTNDTAVAEWFASHEVDVVVHGAVRPGHRNAADPSRQLWSNLRMFFNILRNEEKYRRLVFISSGAVYDTARPLREVGEADFDASVPADEHGLSKYVIAKHIERLWLADRPKVVELRLFGVFGKYEDYTIRFISNAICKAICGLPITLRQDRTFSYLYIDDLMPVVDHFVTAAISAPAYNVVPDWTDDLHDLAVLVRRRSGKDLPIVVGAPGHGPAYCGSNARLRAETPDLKFTPIDEAVDALYDWYETHPEWVDRSLLLVDK
jgi:UDP-glucose 4-epimerase